MKMFNQAGNVLKLAIAGAIVSVTLFTIYYFAIQRPHEQQAAAEAKRQQLQALIDLEQQQKRQLDERLDADTKEY